jgi:hypothetical protein
MTPNRNTTYKSKLCGLLTITWLLSSGVGRACAALPVLLQETSTATTGRQYELVKQLQNYSLLCWDMHTRAMLADILHKQPAHWREWVLLAGSLQMEQPLREILAQCTPGGRRAESVQLALVRCGDKRLLGQMIRAISEKPLNDEFVYRYAPLLVYVRQDTAVQYLLKLISLHERSCSDAAMENTNKLSCAYRLMELLAPVIADFPIPWDPLTEELATPDYEQALAVVRQWISTHRGQYRLRTDIF